MAAVPGRKARAVIVYNDCLQSRSMYEDASSVLISESDCNASHATLVSHVNIANAVTVFESGFGDGN